MVFNRILYNNIKEYTPLWVKTVPTKNAWKPNFSAAHLDARRQTYGRGVATFLTLFRRYVAKIPAAYQTFLFVTAFGLTYGFSTPLLWMYQSNNKHRSAELVWDKVDAIKKKKKEQEDAEESEESE
jgi:hypothetical protein